MSDVFNKALFGPFSDRFTGGGGATGDAALQFHQAARPAPPQAPRFTQPTGPVSTFGAVDPQQELERRQGFPGIDDIPFSDAPDPLIPEAPSEPLSLLEEQQAESLGTGRDTALPSDVPGSTDDADVATDDSLASDRSLGNAFLGLGAQQIQAATGQPSPYERWGGMITAMGGLLKSNGNSKVGMGIAMLGVLTNMYGQRQSGKLQADFQRGFSNNLNEALQLAQRRSSGV